MNKFLKKSEIQIINGGYVCDSNNNPVTNENFIKAQQHAEYIITFYEFSKDKDFKGKKADSIESLKQEVNNYLYSIKPIEYISKPENVKRPLTEELSKEALAFIEFEENSSKVNKINNFMQQFNILNDFEKFGLFFEEGISKLNKIYTINDIKEAVEKIIDLIN